MKVKVFLFLLSFLVSWSAHAQRLFHAEYFIDTDPGPSKGIKIAFAKADSISLSSLQIPLGSLPEGSHLLGVRVKDSLGYWSPTISHPFSILKSGSSTISRIDARLIRAEYFIDSDPGPGKGVKITFPRADSISVTNLQIPMGTLPEGSHLLGVRVADSLGYWSPTISHPFSILKSGSSTISRIDARLIRAEYFIDSDPGMGKGVKITFPRADSISLTNLQIPMGALGEGSHLLGVRVADSLGYWSPTVSHPFSILKSGSSTLTSMVTKVTRAEYFIDADPGPGKGVNITFAKADSISLTNLQISMGSLAIGSHLLGVRVADSLGFWSPTSSHPFTIISGEAEIKNDTTAKSIVYAEYFWGDQDPGLGKGTSFPKLPAANGEWDINASIPVPQDFLIGQNYITIRAKQSNGWWSANETIPFDLCLTPLATPTVTGATICGGSGTAQLKASGAVNNQYSWYDKSYGGTPLPESTNSNYPTPTLTSSRSYYVAAKGAACNSPRISADVTVVQALNTPGTVSTFRCGPGKVMLTATGAPADGSYRWYAADTSKIPLSTGLTYLTDSLLISRTYAVSIISNRGLCESPARKTLAVIVKLCQEQTITFPAPGDFIFGTDEFIKLQATSSSGLPITYEVIYGAVALKNDTLLVRGIGEIMVRAKQAGSLDYFPAASVVRIFKIFSSGNRILVDYDKPACTGDALKLTASAMEDGKYNWTGPNGFKSKLQNPTIYNVSNSDTGKYALVVYAPTDTFTTVLNVDIFESPIKVSLYSIEESKCDKEYRLFAEGDSIYSFQWFYNAKKLIGNTDTTFIPFSSGVYSVTGYNAKGCPASSAPIYVNVDPDSLPPIRRLLASSQLRTSPYKTYQWFVNNYFIVGSNSREIPLIFNGTYNVKVTDQNNCEKFSYDFFVNDENLYTISRASIIGNTINLEDYNSKTIETVPVPANNSTKISWASPERGALKLKVFSAAGMEQAVIHLDKSTEKFTYEFDTSAWKDGLYLLNITCGEKSIVGKITVVH